ncbi:BLUF domain-containing protein [Flavobacterium jejuense]|uniref:BLUF domain-containing protein n=1 Tax=Flavobacterium jejuense TaxID=1544455 RepID=A0ABX0IVB6_9FLAO|nr:BLUF domain-containing protein [Flavobacterium jejuense]NHN26727.1 BLUF domain-containing protein [Flavobacterium jejuense]
MYRIIYLSSATTKFNNDEIIALLKTSRSNNETNGITGLLLYSDGNFLQIIEGKRKPLQKLYGKISMDSRHKNIIKVFEGNVSSRIYSNCKMGFNSIDREFHEKGTIKNTIYENYNTVVNNEDSIASIFIETFLKSSKEKIFIK